MVEIETQRGMVRGVTRGGVHTFWGLRFAEPPERFRPPVRATAPWAGTYDATAPRAQAVQGAPNPRNGPPPPGGYDEDCLFLNVHVPVTESGPRPVLFWIHGGAGIGGSA